MPADRFFLPCPLQTGTILTLKGDEFSHLTHVMRKKKGNRVELVNGRGDLAWGTIQTLEKKEGTLSIDSVEKKEPALPQIILVQALTRQSHLEFIFQRGTELGVTQFWLFPGELSEKKQISAHQCNRLKQITIAALKQCGRLDLPTMTLKAPLHTLSFREGTSYFGDLRKTAPLFKEIEVRALSPYFLIIGPEKGFSKGEIAYLDQEAAGVKLHPYTLRTETAALFALTLLTHHLSK